MVKIQTYAGKKSMSRHSKSISKEIAPALKEMNTKGPRVPTKHVRTKRYILVEDPGDADC